MQNNDLHVADDLGLLDPNWKDWRLRRGMLFDPLSSATIGFRPEEIRALPIRLAQLADLERQLRQLSSLSQLPQARAPKPPENVLARVSWRGAAPVSVQIGPGLVRANPARHSRSR